jgi:sugar (pentulose or hexulose) kinase
LRRSRFICLNFEFKVHTPGPLSTPVYLGIDIGTSGIRGSCIDAQTNELFTHSINTDHPPPVDGSNEQDPQQWLHDFDQLLKAIGQRAQQQQCSIQAIAIDGTSSTLIACKLDGTPLSPALMYNDQQAVEEAEHVSTIAPEDCAVHGASSSLAKALLLLKRYPQTERFCHQADWLAGQLSGRFDISDENNCLKLGYDSRLQDWPAWLTDGLVDGENNKPPLINRNLLAHVLPAGSVVGPVTNDAARRYHLPEHCTVVTGTTDSNAAVLAAVLATGGGELGDAVTSLGSTLVIKLFSGQPIFAPEYGIYSHRLNGHWLVGGASNSGGAVLLQQFTRQQLEDMTPALNPDVATGLDYYPLPATGERFPVNDPNKTSKITPRPDNDVVFFQAMLEGIARIEAEAFKKLEQLGAVPVRRIYTAGGGNRNPAWSKIRERIIGVPVVAAQHTEASYGSALLAKQAVTN